MWKIALKNSSIIVLLSIIVFFVFRWIKIEMPLMFYWLPAYFLACAIVLAVFAAKTVGSKRIMLKMLLFRLAVVVFGMLILLVEYLLDKENMLGFTILFVIYYILFSFFETQTMIKIGKEENVKEENVNP